jgi:hypothetical protein
MLAAPRFAGRLLIAVILTGLLSTAIIQLAGADELTNM